MIDLMPDQESFTPYVVSPCDHVLQDMDRSVVVFGPAGIGKKTAFEQMRMRCAQDVLFAAWDSSLVAETAKATPQIAAFKTVRTAVAEAVIARMRTQPELLAQFSDVSRVFLRWLIENNIESRRRKVLLRIVPALGAIETTPYEDLYPDYSADSLRCQIDEMILLARELGAQKVAITLNLEEDVSTERQEVVQLLLAWRHLWEQPDFLLKAAIPETIVAQNDLVRLARGRILFVRMEWTLAQSWAVAEAWAGVGSSQPVALASLAEKALLEEIADILMDIHGRHHPLAWKMVGELLHDLHDNRKRQLSVTEDGVAIRRRLYHHFAPLRIEADRSGVRRGCRHIHLSELPLSVLEILLQAHTDDTSQALINLTGTKSNLYKQISKLREAVEPLPPHSREWVYVHRIGESHYVLEGAAGAPLFKPR